MAIRIEVLDVTTSREGKPQVRVAMYFPIQAAQQSAMAVDPARTPAGVKLSAPEIVDLKDGKIVEEVHSIDATGFGNAEARTALAALWAERLPIARAHYALTYRWKGDTWTDAPAWINA